MQSKSTQQSASITVRGAFSASARLIEVFFGHITEKI